MAMVSKTRNMLEGLVKDWSFKWLTKRWSVFNEEIEDIGRSPSAGKNWLPELSLMANIVVRRCSKLVLCSTSAVYFLFPIASIFFSKFLVMRMVVLLCSDCEWGYDDIVGATQYEAKLYYVISRIGLINCWVFWLANRIDLCVSILDWHWVGLIIDCSHGLEIGWIETWTHRLLVQKQRINSHCYMQNNRNSGIIAVHVVIVLQYITWKPPVPV